MNPIQEPCMRVAIVDSTPQDYHGLLAAAGKPGVSIHFLSRGNDALRFARRMQSVFWVINTQLPDMSGFDLAEMLRTVRPSAHMFIIGDSYRLDDEMQALTLGLAKYLCKPLEPSWIFPQDQDFCIPMPARRNAQPVLRFVAPSRGDVQEAQDTARGTISLHKIDPEDADQVILPFNQHLPHFPRRPWHKESA